MANANNLVEKQVLRTLVPASALNAENFEELARKAFREEVGAGRSLFKEGGRDNKAVYVLEGEVELFTSAGTQGTIVGETADAKHAIANQQPRQVSARAKTPCVVTRFDSDLLDILLTWDQLSGIEVSDIQGEANEAEDTGDWMTRILQSKAFLRIPPANIQTMFMRLQEMPVKAGQTIIKQGDEGDYYYIISRGKCKVTRAASSGPAVTLAQLKGGDAFGEEALLSEGSRNANVEAETDGLLMRLSKEDFEQLLKEPVLHEVTLDAAKQMVRDGAILLDVRLESEHKGSAIKGSLNIPLFMLRLKSDGLDPSKEFICYCETGRRSSAAAFLLTERGFDGYVLSGGLQAIPQANTG
jgi:CRP-like cAMP-binding protein